MALSHAETAKVCSSCGKWPACCYVDLDQKHLGRICEDCEAAAKEAKQTA